MERERECRRETPYIPFKQGYTWKEGKEVIYVYPTGEKVK